MEILKSLIADYWKNIIIIILLCFVFCSCSVQKKQESINKETFTKEYIETTTTRIGDTVRFEVPNLIYKDTVIYRINKQGTILKTVYDKGGKVTSIDCMASKFEELKRENRDIKELLIKKTKEKTKEFASRTEIILFIIIVFLGLMYFVKK